MGIFMSKKEKLYRRGRDSLRRGSSEDAVNCLKWSAAMGHSGAALLVGDFYREGGLGLPKDGEKALEMYRIVTEPIGRFSEGLTYFFGINGVERDDEKAFALFNEAYTAKKYYVSEAGGFIGAMYFWGRGVQQDYGKAAEYLRKFMQSYSSRYPDVAYCYEYLRYNGLGGLPRTPDDALKNMERIRRTAESEEVRANIAKIFEVRHEEQNRKEQEKIAQKREAERKEREEKEARQISELKEKAEAGNMQAACMIAEMYIRLSRGTYEYEDERTKALNRVLKICEEKPGITEKFRVLHMLTEYSREIEARNREIYEKLNDFVKVTKS